MKNSLTLVSTGAPPEGLTDRRAPGAESKLAASVVHEINNPLESLQNLLYLIGAEGNLTPAGRGYLELAQQEVQRVSEIARSALHDFRDAATPSRTNVVDLLRSVLDFYKKRLESRGIKVRTRFHRDGEVSVYPGPLRQSFSNLLLNAADAMPNGGELHARVAPAREWSGTRRSGVRVTLADTGFGIPSENLSRVLDPFFTTKGGAGSGLGLSLVRDVVRRHRGVLHVRSSTRTGRSGSVFSMFLPVSPEGARAA